ncbi:hypothetical protein I350_06210 [Cryptococcus amylolentus CBS 6273]|uniref:RNA helicase n=1 Tax=Cryptococcus amylolentus CBS 6273 TaxID=1296118 RepID=A0A1E3JKJ4_9TREE|nr:hypothetical protein I350_06210 [Cryptococcus amylolentus CBS 6273]
MLARRALASAQSACHRCVSRTRALTTSPLLSRQVGKSNKPWDASSSQRKGPNSFRNDARPGDRRPPFRPFRQFREPEQMTAEHFRPKPPPKATQVARLLIERLPEWAHSDRALKALAVYGIAPDISKRIATTWFKLAKKGLGTATTEDEALTALAAGGWDAPDLIAALHEDTFAQALESSALRHYLTYALTTPHLTPVQKSHISLILDTTDISRIAYTEYTTARAVKRHFHLHIGPTNSGKTYNALKALSHARSGAYAGPLRLLAHEVWERMNLGSVGGLDGKGRSCNLITGEERRIVDPDSGLLSCTVEMLPLGGLDGEPFDVVVIDEIQMLGDANRGGSWAKAVLGTAAKEIHLCGDETTVELLRGMITSLGDTLTIHEYNRLTPLLVGDASIENDYSRIEDGDCVVTFSRSSIFNLKKEIESQGKKCAVVYGALPPETRAEQAKDFNDENGLCKVLVASDAVGMGLNLKIKRIIFEALSKFNGKEQVPLSLMQVKQIAGRAGRFKTGADKNIATPDEAPAAGGYATTLKPADLPVLRTVLDWKLPSIARAKMDIPTSSLIELAALLPASLTYGDLVKHFSALAKLPPSTVVTDPFNKLAIADVIEPYRQFLSIGEIDLFSFAPLSSRDEKAKEVFRNLVDDYVTLGCVTVESIYSTTDLLPTLDDVLETLQTLPPLSETAIPGLLKNSKKVPPLIINALPKLETLHKSLVLYIWLSLRLEVSFPDRLVAQEWKTKCEAALEECLQRLPGLKMKKGAVDVAGKAWEKKAEAERVEEGVEWVSGAEYQKTKKARIWKDVALLEEGEGVKKRLDSGK